MSRLPLFEKEGAGLELKSRDALQEPEVVGRAVVAMLNAEGGEVWVGFQDVHGRAVAIEPVARPEAAQRRLRDFLIDRIEPSPTASELEVQIVGSEQEGFVLRLVARPQPDRKPYSLLSRDGRLFVVRIGNRVRPLDRQELAELFSRARDRAPSELDTAIARFLLERRHEQGLGGRRLWVRLVPAVEIEIDVQDWKLQELFLDHRLTGNRPDGWSFAIPYGDSKLQPGRMELGGQERGVVIERQGGLTFHASLDALSWKGEERELWPFALLEFPISAFRVARQIYRGKLGAADKLVADLALFGAQGARLRGSSPGRWQFLSRPSSLFRDSDLVSNEPLVFRGDEVESEPDRCGFRLVERVYEAFGLRREMIPAEFDRASGRLILPE